MARAIGKDVIFGLIRLGDLAALKKFTPSDFDWTQTDDENPYCTPLQDAIVNGLICQTKRDNCIEIVEWMLQQGADPQLKLSSANTSSTSLWKRSDMEGTKVTVSYGGHSAISFVLAWLKALQDSALDWTSARKYLEEVMSLFARTTKQQSVTVEPAFLDQWEALLEMTETHNVTFETADVEVTAHDIVLMAASPVLRAMLQSGMKEGANKLIQIKDSPSSGVSLFLEVLYTTATRTDPDYKTMLVALDLAHRWQVQNVVMIAESGLLRMVNVDSFVSIAEAAALKGSERLQRACAAFGTKNAQIQAMLKKGTLPTPVCKLLGQPDTVPPEQQLRKKRKFFQFFQ